MHGLVPRTVQRHPFAVWLCAATTSTLGDTVGFFALGWVAAGLGGGAAATVLTVEGIPLCLLILLGGQLADRHGIRRVMLACDAAMLLVMACFAAGASAGTPLWSLLLVALLAGTVAALRRPAEGVFPRLFAEGEELTRLMATASASLQAAKIAGPVLGGLLVGLGGLTLTASLDALSFGVVLLALLLVRPPLEPAAGDRSASRGWRAIVAGARSARDRPGVPALLATVVGLATTVLPLVMLCVPLAGRDRGWGAGATGAVAAAWLVGTLAVTLVVARRGAAPRWLASAGPVLAAFAVALLAATHDVRVALAAQAAVGAGTALLTTSLVPAYVGRTPPGMLGRFQALLGLAQTGPVLLATPALGLLAAHRGVDAALGLVALVLGLTAWPAARAAAQVSRDAGPQVSEEQEPVTARPLIARGPGTS